MKSNQINENASYSTNEIGIQELFRILFKEKWLIISLSGFALIIGVIISLVLPNIYESRALLAPQSVSNSMPGGLMDYSGIAGLAGISLSSDDNDDNSKKAIKKLMSLSFFEDKIFPKILLQDLMAIKSWDKNTNTLKYNENIYNDNLNVWVRKHSYPQKQIPSPQESFEKFLKEHMSLSEDLKTGFVTLAIKHQSPYVSKRWVDLLVDEINNFYREKDKLESTKSVAYLNQQIKMTNLSEIKQVIAELLQRETQKLTLIEAKQYYVFEYIDPPAVMEKKSKPRRAFICILSLFFGGMISIIIVLIKYYYLIGNKSLKSQ
jgi:LPS O-antigen subunit length determinant protein (WzzB/FepE family)